MNKNLKKVISTIAALAVSASSMVAFATGYPDVPETATYAQAVKELSALNVISGYEDGTFLPDKNVTRAEITKMIVTSLGSATLSAANAAAGKDTKFADVPGSHWASGFVSTATANANSNNGFINGYDETTFGPDDNVTYAQAIKMLVSALGYQTYAENNGGWPNGYLNYGYTLEIADGVTGVSNDTQVTRAQVAQMIDNAVKAPICVIDGYETQWNGTQTPNFVIKDEVSATKKNSWQCLLNYSHDAYVVNGRVKVTQAQGTVDAGEVKIDIEKSNNFDGYGIDPSYQNVKPLELAYVGESEADKYLFTYAEMVLQLNDDDEITILSITPIGGNNKTVEFAAEDFADDKSTYATSNTETTVVAVYESENSTSTDKYEVKYGAELYVNGVKETAGLNATNAEKYLTNNVTGKVTLIDSPAQGKSSVDGVYDYVMVSYYKDAVVESVVGDEEEATIYFANMDSAINSATFNVDTTDEAYSYSFTLTDGTELTALDLQENDVLSIAYDPVKGFADSKSYDVLVSRDTVEGKVSSADVVLDDTNTTTVDESIESEYSINGETYGLASLDLVSTSDLKVSYEYLFYLNAFGKIAQVENTAASNKLAVLDNVYTANGDQYYATLILPDGTKETYTLKDLALADKYQTYCYTGATENAQSPALETGLAKKPIQDRVWSYSVSTSSGNVTLKEYFAPASASGAGLAYKASTSKVGSFKVNEALTSILDAAEYASDKNIAAMSVDGLEDENIYEAYAYNKLSDSSYQMLIITAGTSGSVTSKTEFVVYSKSYVTEVDGDNKTAWLVYKNNGTEVAEVVFDGEPDSSLDGIVEGTPVVIKRNSEGLVTAAAALFDVDVLASYKTFATAVRTGMKSDDMSAVLNTAKLDEYLKYPAVPVAGQDQSNWVFGIVYDRGSNDITLATAADVDAYGKVNVDNLVTYDMDADAGVMTYSYDKKASSGLRVANTVLAAVSKTVAPKVAFDADEVTLNLEHQVFVGTTQAPLETATYGKTTFALAKTIDGDIVELYAIIPSPKN